MFKKLVTIGMSPGSPGPPFFSDAYLTRHRELSEQGDVVGIIRLHTSSVLSEPATRELQELFVRNRLGLPRETLLSFFDPDPTVDVAPILGEIVLPVLVTHGGADQLISVEAAAFIAARLPNAMMHVFEGKGHMPLFTATDEFCKVVRNFVRRSTSSVNRAPVTS
jgi:pimeloyl-ACP methyl ester carboxylesterase